MKVLALLEILRAGLILLLLGGLLTQLYSAFTGELAQQSTFSISLGVGILIVILYRNKFQFHGWYRESARKLSKQTMKGLIGVSLGLLILPFFF